MNTDFWASLAADGRRFGCGMSLWATDGHRWTQMNPIPRALLAADRRRWMPIWLTLRLRGGRGWDVGSGITGGGRGTRKNEAICGRNWLCFLMLAAVGLDGQIGRASCR